jgi:hypothetical protein
MRDSGFASKVAIAMLAGFGALFFYFIGQTDVGNWFRKAGYAEWSSYLEEGLTSSNAEVHTIDFGTFQESDDEFFVAIEMAEPTHEYEIERLFVDVHRIVIDAYLKSDPPPPEPDSILVLVTAPDIRFAVIAPFQIVMDYVESGSNYDRYVESWEHVVDFGQDPGGKGE